MESVEEVTFKSEDEIKNIMNDIACKPKLIKKEKIMDALDFLLLSLGMCRKTNTSGNTYWKFESFCCCRKKKSDAKDGKDIIEEVKNDTKIDNAKTGDNIILSIIVAIISIILVGVLFIVEKYYNI